MKINTWYEIEDLYATEINYIYIINYSNNVEYYYVTFNDSEGETYEFNKLNLTKKEFDMYFETEYETRSDVSERYVINKCFAGYYG